MSAAADKDYSTLQDIREEAGHQHSMVRETMTGTANGSNKDFYVAKLPIVDSDYDDDVDTSDVVVYDDGTIVAVSAVDATTGTISVTAAPASSSVMKATYKYSTVTDTRVTGVRDEAIAWVQRKLTGLVDYTAWTDTNLPADIRLIVRLFAAALIMIRSYGSNTDNELVSKDGYKKLQTAMDLMTDYLKSIADDSTTSTPVTSTLKTDGNLFARNTDLANTYDETSETDEFFNKDN